MSRIFISYSHSDGDYARALAQALEAEGFAVFIDDRIDYGSQWPHVIQEELDRSAAFVVVMTPRAYESEWVQNELSRAKRKRKAIFPLLLEGDEPWLSVEATQYADVRQRKLPPPAFYARLARAVTERDSQRKIEGSLILELAKALANKSYKAVTIRPRSRPGAVLVHIHHGTVEQFKMLRGSRTLLTPVKTAIIEVTAADIARMDLRRQQTMALNTIRSSRAALEAAGWQIEFDSERALVSRVLDLSSVEMRVKEAARIVKLLLHVAGTGDFVVESSGGISWLEPPRDWEVK